MRDSVRFLIQHLETFDHGPSYSMHYSKKLLQLRYRFFYIVPDLSEHSEKHFSIQHDQHGICSGNSA